MAPQELILSSGADIVETNEALDNLVVHLQTALELQLGRTQRAWALRMARRQVMVKVGSRETTGPEPFLG